MRLVHQQLIDLWAEALESEPQPDGLLFRAYFETAAAASNARLALYRMRSKTRTMNSGKTPWDHITINQPGAGKNNKGGERFLEFRSGPSLDFVIVKPGEPEPGEFAEAKEELDSWQVDDRPELPAPKPGATTPLSTPPKKRSRKPPTA